MRDPEIRSKHFRTAFLILIFTYLVMSCEPEKEILKTEGGFPDTPRNLTIFNSTYDDYNSDLDPGVYDMNTFIFSSNRNSQGDDHDIMLYSLGMSYPFEEDVVSIYKSAGVTGIYLSIKEMQSGINTSNNEFGPYIFRCNLNTDYREEEFLLFFAQEVSDNLDIKFMVNELDLSENPTRKYKWSGPYDVRIINTVEFNESYISINNGTIYFCSDHGGNYDIYKIPINSDLNLIDFLTTSDTSINYHNITVNSDTDDKCPYVIDNFMVFVSNRSGGSGGYDLWYSRLYDEVWSEPQNFGSTINTEFDEYPIFIAEEFIL